MNNTKIFNRCELSVRFSPGHKLCQFLFLSSKLNEKCSSSSGGEGQWKEERLHPKDYHQDCTYTHLIAIMRKRQYPQYCQYRRRLSWLKSDDIAQA